MLLAMKMIIIIIKPVMHTVKTIGLLPKRRVFRYEKALDGEADLLDGLSADCSLVAFKRGIDEELLLSLNNEIFRDHPDQGAWSMGKLMTRLNETLQYESDLQILLYQGGPVGFVWLKHHKLLEFSPCEIYVVGVLESFRDIGLGKFLVSVALQRMQGLGCKTAWVYTDEANMRARNLYESFGFRLDFIEEL